MTQRFTPRPMFTALALTLCLSLAAGCGSDEGQGDTTTTQCTPGESFDHDCNTCECPDSGLKSEADCTTLDCTPEPFDGCADLPCGTSNCELCDPEDPDCVPVAATTYCDAAGQCVVGDVGQADCEAPYDGCADLPCGAECELCDPEDPDCVPSDASTYCNATGVCTTGAAQPDECEESDPCAEVTCPSTDAYCEGDVANSGSYSECINGECVPAPGLGPEDCAAQGMTCENGSCVALDLCADVNCTVEDMAYCEGDMAVTTNGAGTCDQNDGECYWDVMNQVDCAEQGQVCLDGACVDGDLCKGVVCETEPAYCDGSIAVYGGVATCNPETGECEYLAAEGPEDCEEIGLTCIDGACVDDTCTPTETYYFLDDDGCHSCKCPASGQKSDATCAITSDVSLCGVVDLCANVICEPTDGFCDGDIAHAGAMTSCDPETGECKAGAMALPKNCTLIDQVCLEGTCVDPDEATCTPGEDFLATDGCNTCVCPDTGMKSDASVCTEMACPDQCLESACGPMPALPNYLCEDGETMAGPGDCEMQEDDTCGWTVVTCPETDTCTPGESFEAADGCNTCICPESGLVSEANCTKMACVCTKAADCGEGYFCDFSTDDCGVWSNAGLCAKSPEMCVAGGPGACSCSGHVATNGCELNAMGEDVFQYGGCSMDDPETYACGEVTCSAATEYCAISMNDVMGPMQPIFYNNCVTLIDECTQGDCSCMSTDGLTQCYDGTGYTFMFYPGG